MDDPIYRDAPTGLYNRRYLEELLPEVIAELTRQDQSFTLVIVDIDHFKMVNDLYGHDRGDAVIKSFAQFLQEATRSSDKVIRYGGDEFVCFLPNMGRQNAEALYGRVIRQCHEKDFDGLSVSISVGLASCPDDGKDYQQLFAVADASLYEAKRSGRNRLGAVQKKQITLPIKAFVDRRDEIVTLLHTITSDEKRLRIVIVNGNIGVGKTRFTSEGLDLIRGYEVLWADCLLFDEPIAYYAIRELVKYRLQRRGAEIFDKLPLMYRHEIGKLAPEILENITGEVDPASLVVDRYRLYESVRKSFEIGEQAKAVVIDNFQWVDKESLETLRYVFRALKDQPNIFILINRVEEVPEAILDFLGEVSREVIVDEIRLAPLPVSQVRECVRAIIGDEPDERLVEYTFQSSGGNPYFLEELFRGLEAGGYLTLENDQWQFRVPEEEIVPKSVEQIAQRKYRLLSIEAQTVLRFASILGRFDLGMLRHLTGYGKGELQGLLTDIQRVGFVREAQGRMVFIDEFSRRAIYRKFVAGAGAAGLHRQVAEKLELDYRGREAEVLDELAMNYYYADDKAKGLEYCMLAGKKAQEKYANEDAIRYYQWAEELLTDDKAQQYELLLAREKAYDLQGMREAQRQDLQVLRRLAQDLQDSYRQAQVALRQAAFYDAFSDLALVIATAQEAVHLAQAAQAPGAEAEGHLWWGTALQLQNQYQSAQVQLELAIALARGADAHTTEAFSLLYLGMIRLNNYNDHAGAADCFEHSLLIYRQIGDRHGEARALRRLGHLSSGHPFVPQSSYLKAIEYYEQSLSVAREVGNRRDECAALGSLGIVFQKLGAYDQVNTYHQLTLQLAAEINASLSTCDSLLDHGLYLHRINDDKAALECLQRALQIAQETNINEYISTGWYYLGCALANLGRLPEAAEAHQKSIKLRHEAGVIQLTLEPLAGLAQVCQAQGDLSQALAYVEEILIYQQDHVLYGLEDYFQIGLTCYRVLRATQDSRAEDVLRKAYQMLQEQAAKITDLELQRSFLENVAAHREIVRAYTESQGKLGEPYG